jgi:hypothetical protein
LFLSPAAITLRPSSKLVRRPHERSRLELISITHPRRYVAGMPELPFNGDRDDCYEA